MEPARELIVGFVGDDGERVHVGVVVALSLLVHAEAKAASDLLALGHSVRGVDERAYLEDVGVVPALFQGRVAEDEGDVLHVVFVIWEADEALFGLHDRFEGGGVGVGGAVRILELPLAVLGEVALVEG